jgi:ABC-type multidrug transport system fused ATPase/permease subunit
VHVLEGGRVVESGHHDQLLARGRTYAQLWHTIPSNAAILCANSAQSA